MMTIAVTAATLHAAKPSAWDADADRRKAQYVFTQAIGMIGADSVDIGMLLLDRAHALDAANTDISTLRSEMLLTMGRGDSATLSQAYSDFMTSFRNRPDDYWLGMSTAQLASELRQYDDQIDIWQTIEKTHPSLTEPSEQLATAYLTRYIVNTDTADYNRALAILTRLEDGTGSDLGLSSQKIRAYLLRQDTMSVVDEIGRLVKGMPGETRPLLFASEIYDVLGRDSLSLAMIQQACLVDSTDGQARVKLAEKFLQMGDSVQYDREVYRALRSPSLEFDIKCDLLTKYVGRHLEEGDSTAYTGVQNLFAVIEDVNPGEPRLHGLHGLTAYLHQDTRTAIEQFNYAIALDPTDSRTRQLAMGVLQASDSLDDAIALARQGRQLFPDELSYPISEAQLFVQKKDYPSALDVLKTINTDSITEAKQRATVHSFMGEMYSMMDSTDQAIDRYQKAIADNPDEFMTYNNYAYMLANKDIDYDKAESYARIALLSESDNPTVIDTYAWVLFKKKDYPKARTEMEKALRESGVMLIGDTLYYEHNDSSVMFVNDRLRFNPQLPDSIDEDTDINQQIFEGDDNGLSSEILSHAGDIFFMTGDADQALVFWQKALALKPDDELLQRKVKHKTFFFK